MDQPTRRISWPPGTTDPEALVTREWLVANGLGGYASGTVSGVITRRYHGLLIAALPAPLGRIVMLSTVAEQVKLVGGRVDELGGGVGAAGAKPRSAAASDRATRVTRTAPAISLRSASRPDCLSGATTSRASSSRSA